MTAVLLIGSLRLNVWINVHLETKDFLSTTESITKPQSDLIEKELSEFGQNPEMAFAFIRRSQIDFYGLKRINAQNEKVENSKSVF